MPSIQLGAALAALFAVGASAACSGDLQIDNWSGYASAVNSMGDATSDDGSMTSITATNGVLKFTPKDVNSYYYESFPCVQARSSNYGGLQFTMTYPAGSSFSIEAQTKKNCQQTNYTSEWFPISGLSGTQQVVTLDLNVYQDSNTDAVVGFVFAGFDKSQEWTISDLKFTCGSLDALELPARNRRSAGLAAPAAMGASSAKFASSQETEPGQAPPSSAGIPASSSPLALLPSPRPSSLESSSVATNSIPSRSSETEPPALEGSGTSFFIATSPAHPQSSSAPLADPDTRPDVADSNPSPAAPAAVLSKTVISFSARSTLTTMTKPAPVSSPTLAQSESEELQQGSSVELTMSMIVPRAQSEATTKTKKKTARETTTRASYTTSSAVKADECDGILIDDWESQSRLTFLYYNSLHQSSSDDGSMRSIVVNNDNTVTLTPQNTDSYFYSQLPCVDAASRYGGISLKIQAAAGTTFSIRLTSSDNCGSSKSTSQTVTTSELGWKFNGEQDYYNIPLSAFGRINAGSINMLFFSSFTRPVTISPMAFYCGDDPLYYSAPDHIVNQQPSSTVSTPRGTAAALVIDEFTSKDGNALGLWHGCDDDCVSSTYSRNGGVTLQTNDSDLSWYTALADKCADISAYSASYLHLSYSGSSKFTISLQQANPSCNSNIAPFPETWDSVEASRYASGSDIYIPLSHFKVELGRVTNFALKGFYTTATTTLKKMELVPSVPSGWKMPNRLPTGNLVFACKRPNSFAFAIDDGDPKYAQEVMEIVRSENIKVTFFTVGLPLEDSGTNLSTVYKDMQRRGHQIALHSFTHPKMEGLPDYAAIDWEYNNDIATVGNTFNGMHTPYFRPPFGTEGARMRHRLATALGTPDPYIVMWSVDVEDWRWGTSDTPEKQLEAFKRDLNKGGSLTVMHYLYPNTIKYLRQFIQLAKATGKQLMRVDQCMMDPNAPPL